MKDKSFKWTVLGMLALLVVISIVAWGGKKQTTPDGGTELKMFGKTLLKTGAKTAEKKAELSKYN